MEPNSQNVVEEVLSLALVCPYLVFLPSATETKVGCEFLFSVNDNCANKTGM